MPVALILPGKLFPGDPRRQQAVDCGFRVQRIWTRPEELVGKMTIRDLESPLFKLHPYQFFVYKGEKGPLSVVLSASDQCAALLVDSGFEAGIALTKWFRHDEIPPEVKEITVVTDYLGMEAD